jgi:hypothetical protein
MILKIAFLTLAILFSGYVAFKIYRFVPVNNIAKWARRNKGSARWLLVVFNLAMAVLGVTIGLLCSTLDLHMNESVLYAGLGLFAIGTVFYPSRKKGTFEIAGRLGKRRVMTALRLSGGAIAAISFANIFLSGHVELVTSEAAVHPAFWIVLSTLGLVALGFGVLVLSCGLACNGYETAALVLAVGGVGGLVALYVVIIVKVMKNHKKRQGLEDTHPELLDEI